MIDIISWPSIEAGQSITQPCFQNSTLNITALRVCLKNGTWSQPNTTLCSSGKLYKIRTL